MSRRVLLLAGMLAGSLFLTAGLTPQTSTLMSAEPAGKQAVVEKAATIPIGSFGIPTSPADAKILKALGEPTELSLIDEPLQSALKHLSNRHKIQIVLDRVALEDIDIDTDEPITLKVSGISLRSGLDLILRSLRMTWTIDSEVLLITTPDQAEIRMTTKTYDVSDLAVYHDESGRLCEDYHELIDLIVGAIASDSWEGRSGGPGGIEGCTFGSAKVLVVRQLYQAHLKIAQLLSAIRAAPIESIGIAAGPAELKILKALAEPTELTVIEEPLQGVIDYLADRHKIPILLDIRALDNVDIGKDEPITLDLSGISLRSALELVLRDLDLTWMIDSEVLIVTTPYVQEEEIVKVYHVADLASYHDENGRPWVDYGELIDTVMANIAPECWGMDWRDQAATGTFGDAQVFVVRQTWQVQLEVDQFIRTIREISQRHASEDQPPN